MSQLRTIEEIERAVEENRLDLSEWESGFLESVKAAVQHGRTLSDKQEDVLTKIWEKIR